MSRNIILVSVLFVVALAGIMWWGRDAQTTSSVQSNVGALAAGSLVAEETVYDFGTIAMKDGVVSHQFRVRNDSEAPVLIQKVYTSCMCTTVNIQLRSGKTYGAFGMPGHGPSKTNIEVGPHEEATVLAMFDPNAHGPSGVGLANRSVYLETNSPKTKQVELRFSALVVR